MTDNKDFQNLKNQYTILENQYVNIIEQVSRLLLLNDYKNLSNRELSNMWRNITVNNHKIDTKEIHKLYLEKKAKQKKPKYVHIGFISKSKKDYNKYIKNIIDKDIFDIYHPIIDIADVYKLRNLDKIMYTKKANKNEYFKDIDRLCKELLLKNTAKE